MDANMTEIDGGDNSSDVIRCEDNYIPTVAEYSKAMGAYQTALLAVGGCTTVLLYGSLARQVHHILRHVDKRFRGHVLWLTSVCPFMTLMSVISVIVPRADTACTAFKVTYLALCLSHFMDLTTAMFGNEKIMLEKLKDQKFNLHVGPACYCCFCLPSPLVTRDKLRWVRWLLWQMPYTQAVSFMVQIIWSTAVSDTQGRQDPNFNMLWLISLSFVTIVAGIYGLQIITALCLDHLKDYGYQRKAFAIKILILASQLQSFTLDILSLFKIYPCMGPYISPRVFKQTLENMLYLPEMLVIGLLTWRIYMTLELESQGTKDQGALPTTDPSHPRSSFASVDKGSSPHKMQSLDVPSHPRSFSSSSSPRYSVDKGSDSTDKGLNAAYNSRIRFPHGDSSSVSNAYSPRPYSSSLQLPHDSSSLHPSSFSSTPPPRPPRSLRPSSSTSVPSHSSTSPDSSHDSKNLRVSPDSCLYSASPTTSSSLPPYSPSGDEKEGEERVDLEAGRREGRYER
ncbi:organic solute transporter alpha-like protein isoform X2 [Eriocheir sinensis]|nr:organic solute transporter alpha-like protein isoform X2 [Eriocheir sinensis]XP_050730292.1 organic solute transporter alpha-like protein isoform X2 [Eriocheir sinensis]